MTRPWLAPAATSAALTLASAWFAGSVAGWSLSLVSGAFAVVALLRLPTR